VTERRKPPAAGKGRPKGAQNKTTVEVRAAAQKLVEDAAYRAELKTRLKEGKAPHMETLLWYYAYGKPKEQMEVTGEDGSALGPITLIVKGRAA
jgi:hypothetical protein